MCFLKEVRFRPDHKSISQELAAHIEDRADWFCGQGMSAYNAAVLGAFVHGLGGDMAAEDKGKFGMSACDVVEKLPYAIKFLSE